MGVYDTVIWANNERIQIKCFTSFMAEYRIGDQLPSLGHHNTYTIFDHVHSKKVIIVRNNIITDVVRYNMLDVGTLPSNCFNKYGSRMYLKYPSDYTNFISNKPTYTMQRVLKTKSFKLLDRLLIQLSRKGLSYLLDECSFEDKKYILLELLKNPNIIDFDRAAEDPDYYKRIVKYLIEHRETGEVI